ncbi:sulfite exporter TauE/SafE family protein [Methanocella sp. CWC-04]|uniref:Probable membrane transporter protein n=1 Tax=Methanooceanicella nereidis TaxID=2052831 RepID=A0AAP2RGF9_9EURY|nr:sulfite exporter TauE/SafE family protein [Methanocella sp. CWC-04]MCD1296165.1 sulfite exporter TauE/SafE family protein [Methanocella sp. CWC-04]
MEMLEALLFLMTGTLIGSFSALLGIGGAVILIPVLSLLFGLPIQMAMAIALITNVAVSLSAVLKYERKGLLHRNAVKIMNIAAVPGIIAGIAISTNSPASAIMILYGSFLLFMVALAFVNNKSKDREPIKEPEHIDRKGHSMLGFIIGILCGALGLGGGGLAVSVQTNFFKTPIKNAIANSMGTIAIASTIGAILYFMFSGTLFDAEEALIITAMTVPGAVIGARISAGAADMLKTKYIRYAFNLTLLYIAYSMITRGLGW